MFAQFRILKGGRQYVIAPKYAFEKFHKNHQVFRVDKNFVDIYCPVMCNAASIDRRGSICR